MLKPFVYLLSWMTKQFEFLRFVKWKLFVSAILIASQERSCLTFKLLLAFSLSLSLSLSHTHTPKSKTDEALLKNIQTLVPSHCLKSKQIFLSKDLFVCAERERVGVRVMQVCAIYIDRYRQSVKVRITIHWKILRRPSIRSNNVLPIFLSLLFLNTIYFPLCFSPCCISLCLSIVFFLISAKDLLELFSEIQNIFLCFISLRETALLLLKASLIF